MQLSQIPTLVPLPFAANGTKNAIPETSQIGVTPGAASLNDGFPPLTFTPLAAGGVPPSGADFNGILNLLSANTQWQNAGGFFPYSASFSAAIGGYPKTALLAKASGLGFWLSLEDNNTSDPDTGGAGWIGFDPWAIQAAEYITAKDTGTANAYAVTLSPAPSALTPGMLVNILQIANTNTGAATLAVNGLSTLPILLARGTALSGGELTAGYGAIVRLNSAGTSWELVFSAANTFGVQLGQIFNLLEPTASESITPSALNTVVLPGALTGAITLTIEPGTVVGQEVEVFGSNYAVTVQSSASSGSPSFALPDGSFIFSWVIPASYGQSFKLVWDGTDYRATTHGQTVVAPATQDNAAVQLGQLTDGSLSPSFGQTIVADATESNQAVALGQLNSLMGVHYDIAGGFSGLGSANNVLLDYVSVRAVTFGANFAGSLGMAGIAATAATTYTIEINGAAVGTMNFVAGAAAATFTSSGGAVVNLSAGQNLRVIGPATPDATLANLTFTLGGSITLNITSTSAYDISGGFSNIGSANQVILDYAATRTITFAANFAGAVGIAGTAATADVVYTIEINGAAVGTLNIAAAATTATFTSSGGAVVNLSAGQNLRVIGPATPDATLANLTFTLLGSAS